MFGRQCFVAMLAFGAAISAGAQDLFRPGEGVANDRTGNVSFVARGGGNDYGYGLGRQYVTPFGLTLLAWDVPNSFSVVRGVRANLGCGRFERVYGADLGLYSSCGDFCGVAANLVGNFSDRDAAGLECGLVNMAKNSVRGVQVGLFNQAGCLYGVQIGLINVNGCGIVLPVLNVGW